MSSSAAKKKSTMTLKDFHGGSIPSELPLPSAPGVIVRPETQRPLSSNSSSRILRPGSSSGPVRPDNNKTPFLTTTMNNIGRHFDEDERSVMGAPRRTVSDDIVRGGGGPPPPTTFRHNNNNPSSYSSRVSHRPHTGGTGGGSVSNESVWRRGGEERESSGGGSTTVVEKFAQASAIDKVISGRWHSSKSGGGVDVEVIRPGSEGGGRESRVAQVMVVGVGGEEGGGGGERVRTPPEGVERPKLKLLPRTKPIESPEPSPVGDNNKHFGGLMPPPQQQQRKENRNVQVGGGNVQGNVTHVRAGVISGEANSVKQVGGEVGSKVVERPKLNLKPRSQPVDQVEGKVTMTERERLALFGGARPREMVLKERGVDDVSSNEEVPPPSRVKNDAPRAEVAAVRGNTSRHIERVENPAVADHRTARSHEKREQRPDAQRGDMQKKNWRNENWRNNRDVDKQQQPERERQPSPETWRKPVEPPKPSDSGLRFGKAVSAVELAQAFSKPVSAPKPVDQFSGQRGNSGRNQVPFSRLTGPPPRTQINGY